MSQLLADCVCVCEGIGRCFLALIPTTLSPNDQQFLYLFALLLHLPLFMRSLSSVHLPCSFSYVVCLSPHTHTHTTAHIHPFPITLFLFVGSNAEVNLIYCIYAAFAAFLPPAGHQAKSLGEPGKENSQAKSQLLQILFRFPLIEERNCLFLRNKS